MLMKLEVSLRGSEYWISLLNRLVPRDTIEDDTDVW